MRVGLRYFSVSMLIGALLASGCASPKRPSSGNAEPFTREQLDELRASYKAPFPRARIGVVTAVLPDQPLALVGDIDAAGITVGTIVTFVDATETVITNGRVVLINASGLTVQFDAGKRRPIVGDAAIKF